MTHMTLFISFQEKKNENWSNRSKFDYVSIFFLSKMCFCIETKGKKLVLPSVIRYFTSSISVWHLANQFCLTWPCKGKNRIDALWNKMIWDVHGLTRHSAWEALGKSIHFWPSEWSFGCIWIPNKILTILNSFEGSNYFGKFEIRTSDL